MIGELNINKRRIILILSLLFILFPIAFYITNPSIKMQSASGKRIVSTREQLFIQDSLLSFQRTQEIPVSYSSPATQTPGAYQETSNNLPLLAIKDGSFSQLFSFDPNTSALTRLTSNTWDDITPAINPDGTKLALSSNRDGSWDLYIIDLLNGDVFNLTNTEGYDASPSWSPDGKWIVFESYIDENLEIQIISTTPGDGAPIRLTNNRAADHSPVWAPEGRSVLFVSNRTGDEEIWLADLDSSDERFRNISNQPATLDRDPDWSPDGSHIAWTSIENGAANIIQLDLLLSKKMVIGSGSMPRYSPDGRSLLAVIENPNEYLVTSYSNFSRNTSTIPKKLPGKINGISWQATGQLSEISLSDLQEIEAANNTGDWVPEEGTAIGSVIVELTGINAPHAFLHEDVFSSFYELRHQIETETGWNYLDYLEDAFLPLTSPPSPEMNRSWLYTGRAIAVNPMPLYAGWIAAVREDYYGQTYWRLYLKARYQDGSQGMPLQSPAWNFNARYSGNTLSYEHGGELSNVPEGYWIDFTEAALRFGWKRLPALNNWRTYFNGTLFNHYFQDNGLDWQTAMEELYPQEALATATRFPTKTQTPTATQTFTRTPWMTATLPPSMTPSATPSQTATPE